ncbi:hypothetical protein HHI36_000683 [Cryptolaemus montrouzieri]|uniref:Uncharacterized protein n=1 Tax=Cryptolaemus montrouzieri TaxID=559131 RepID=A0ABD2P5H4_9CUCU
MGRCTPPKCFANISIEFRYDECFYEVDELEELHLTLLPPEDEADSDQDDGPCEDDEMCRIGDIGEGVLKQKMDVTCIWKGEKQALIGSWP